MLYVVILLNSLRQCVGVVSLCEGFMAYAFLFAGIGEYHCHRPEAFYQILTCLIRALWVHVTYLFIKCVTESCDSPDWLIQYCLSSASSRVTEMVSMKMPCGECFQKCFRAYNMISLWLNTVIPIIVMIWLPKMTRYLN